VGEAERVRKQIAGDLVAEIRALDARLKSNEKAMAELVEASGSTLTQTVGIGAVTAARLIGRTGRPSRFPTCAAYATYTGAAPVEVASADKGSSSPLTVRGPAAQLRVTHHRGHPDPDDRQPRQHLLPHQDRRG
jgi:transposase